jgi:hypothetical protein
MAMPRQPEALGRMLGWGGLLLALAGAVGILYLREPAPNNAPTSTVPLAIGLIAPFLLAAVLMAIPATRDNSLPWLLTGAWSGLLAAMTIFSVGIIFLIATAFLLAAFVRANW